MPEAPDIGFFARTHLAALNALGIEHFDLYGTHTGAAIAIEIAIAAPQRVRRLILDGVSVYTDEQQQEFLARYAPEVRPDLQAQHLMWAWHFVRDTYMFWPWYRVDSAAHRRAIPLPSADILHEKLVEVLKALTTYHKSYRAAFAHDKRARLKLLPRGVPTLATCARTDMLAPMFEEFATLIPHAERAPNDGTATPEAVAATVARFTQFLDAP
jgi:pimeloyl-ACP methyl ester carboxylesterase